MASRHYPEVNKSIETNLKKLYTFSMTIRKNDFPLLSSSQLIYFDNASTTHKPLEVIEAMNNFYRTSYGPVHRGVYRLSEQATQQFEQVRTQVSSFINAQPHEIVFTQGTTHGINFIAFTWALHTLKPGDEIVLTELEHHSNMIPWQQIAQRTGAVLRYIPINPDGTLEYSKLETIITERTKLVTIVHVSNALGTHNDIALIGKHARKVGAKIFIDAAQSVAHQRLDVKKLDVDFLAFSGHKIVGPTGIGVLYIRSEIQPEVPPYQFGGGMVFHASYNNATWDKAPACYEAGTPPITEVIGLGAAINYIQKNNNFDEQLQHEAQLCAALINECENIPQVHLLGPLEELKTKGHLISFTVDGWHPHDVGAFLDQHNIAVRTGHYCAQPLAQKLGIPQGSIRLSFYAYNTLEEVEYCSKVIKKILSSK